MASLVTTIKRVFSKMLEPYFIEVLAEDVCVGASRVAVEDSDGKRRRHS